jgi:putative transposase
MHDEWQSGERHYLSEGSMAQLKPRDSGGVVAIGSGE